MARQFNYEWTDSSQISELNMDYSPANKKNEVCQGGFVMQSSLQIRVFWIGGILYALDFFQRFAAGYEQRI